MMMSKRELKKALEEGIEKYEELLKARDKFTLLKERLLDVADKLRFKYIKRPIYKFRKLIRWIPVIWKSEDWDYYYLLELIRIKLQDMKDYFLEENILSTRDLEIITSSVDKTCEHIHDFEYHYEVFEERNKLPFTLGSRHELTPDGKGYYIVNWNEDEDRPLNDEEEKMYKGYLTDLWKFENEEWEAVWDTIKENGRRWWS